VPSARNSAWHPEAEELLLEPLPSGEKLVRKTPGWFRKAQADTAAEQWELVRRIEQSRHWRDAARACDALVRRWPYAPEAAWAQQRLAELNEQRGRYKRAFADYRYLLYFYADQVSLAEILPRLYAIANHYRAKGSEPHALRMFRQLADLAPRWPQTPDALLQAGLLQVKDKDWYDAIGTFDRITANYPGTPEAETAAAQAAFVLHRLSLRFPEDDGIHLRALAALAATLRDYPEHTEREALARKSAELTTRRQARFFAMARFYDTPRFKPETAAAAYRDFVRRFPNAPQAEEARQRLTRLSGAADESPTKEP
jgi:outer membrane protein assembly factor BamD (BamD/ComL family)